MRSRWNPRALGLLGAAALLASACPGSSPEADAGDDGGEADAPAEGGGGGDADAPVVVDDADVVSGPAIFVMSELEITDERMCDLDGDGVGDNAVADLGSPGSALMLTALNVSTTQSIEEGATRVLFHFPWVDDLTTPADDDTIIGVYRGNDPDAVLDRTDDFSGEEPFMADPQDLDPCGEPRPMIEGVSIDDGVISSADALIPFPVHSGGAFLRGGMAEGTLAPLAESLQLSTCGYITATDLGRGETSSGGGSLTSLEFLLAGGASFGMPTVPGLALDVDVDGDGIERFILDGDGRVAECVDGDETVIPGRDCWADPRIADGMSWVMEIRAVGARFAGRDAGWEHMVTGLCETGRPAESFFDTVSGFEGECAAPGEACDPLLAEPCCDPSTWCTGEQPKEWACRQLCTPVPCSFGPRLGGCQADGLCWPGWEALITGCELGAEGCTTEHGVSAGTSCVATSPGGGGGSDTVCLEACEGTPEGCGDREICLPFPWGDEGICIRPRFVEFN